MRAGFGNATVNREKMSMYFRVKDQTVLEGIAAGDKVRFEMGQEPGDRAHRKGDQVKPLPRRP